MGNAAEFCSSEPGSAWRDDPARIHHPIPAAESFARLDLRNAGWKIGAVSDRDGELRISNMPTAHNAFKLLAEGVVMTNRINYEVGLLVVHPRKTEWGLGRILQIDGSKITVYFRDLLGDSPDAAKRILDTRFVSLDRALNQSDYLLDNLPPYIDGKFQRPLKKRITLEEGIEQFRRHFPLLFDDPDYIDALCANVGERTYKCAAHEQFQQTLGVDEFERLLRTDMIEELRRRALAVEGRINLLAVFEKAAFRDGLRNDAAAKKYFEALLRILKAPDIDPGFFETYLDTVASLPAEGGKTSPAKWTVATVLPFIAQPKRFMFLKPVVTQDCAARLTFELNYRPELNWMTYAKLLEMSQYLLDVLRPHGARDFIDV